MAFVRLPLTVVKFGSFQRMTCLVDMKKQDYRQIRIRQMDAGWHITPIAKTVKKRGSGFSPQQGDKHDV
jgi:hypothetical protein